MLDKMVGCVTTTDLANGAVTSPKIAPGAVALSSAQYYSGGTAVGPGQTNSAVVVCPSNTFATGGGLSQSNTGAYLISSSPPDAATPTTSWQVIVQTLLQSLIPFLQS